MKKLPIALFCVAVLAAQPKETAPAGWRQDLKFFAEHFSKGHCTPADIFHSPLTAFQPCHQADFAKLYPQPAFDNEIAAIEESIPKLTDAQIVLRLTRLVASANVGHTSVELPALKLGFRLLPLSLRWYADGLAVTAATPAYSAALAARVLRIGSLTADQIMTAVAPYLAHENETWLHVAGPQMLNRIPLLQQIGAADADGKTVITLAKAGGEPFTLSVAPRDPRVKEVDMFEELHLPAAIYGKHPTSFYWYEYLADSRALYIQYNRCANDPKQSFGAFTRDLLAFADKHAVDRAIVDLRFNGGGNSMIIHPLKSGLKSRGYPVFVLIGASAFSSAQDNAIAFRRQLGATLVGEPTGEKPNGYGEVRYLKLPNSGLHIAYSTAFFRMVKGSDADALEPDIRLPRTLADELTGRDAALDAAIQSHSKNRP